MFVTLETLGRPIVMKRVWKSFVATNPDALSNHMLEQNTQTHGYTLCDNFIQILIKVVLLSHDYHIISHQ